MAIKTGKDMTPEERKKRAHISYSKSWKTGTRKKKNKYEPCATFNGKVVCNLGKKKSKVDKEKNPKQTPSPVKIDKDKKPAVATKEVKKTPSAQMIKDMSDSEIKKLYSKVSVEKINKILEAEALRQKGVTSRNLGGTKAQKIRRLFAKGRSVTP